jgi:hypothetical protein
MNIYHYLFYGIYSIWKKMPGKDHAFLSMLVLTTLWFLNAVNGIVIYERLTGKKFENTIVLILSIFFLFFSINYYLFVHNKKYIKIEENIKQKPLVFKIITYIILLLLVLFTIVLTSLVNQGYWK